MYHPYQQFLDPPLIVSNEIPIAILDVAVLRFRINLCFIQFVI